ncbi:hypothetical protein Tco_1315198 [Tanacetum coccineum]
MKTLSDGAGPRVKRKDYAKSITKPLGPKRKDSRSWHIPIALKYALWGISHWREQRKSFYAYARGISRGDVYSTKCILAVTHVKVMRKHRYEYLEEIVVKRADNVLYSSTEVEDLQLGVESYQKQVNVTKPDTIRPDLRKRNPYTPYKDPQGFIYVDDYKRNRLMRSDELYKFCGWHVNMTSFSLKGPSLEYRQLGVLSKENDGAHWKAKRVIS